MGSATETLVDVVKPATTQMSGVDIPHGATSASAKATGEI
jgi:hypothetical protein